MSASASLADQTVIHAYRHLYRQGLRTIRYATPGRLVLRSTLRSSFRSTPRDEFDPLKIANTLRFLQRASDATGFEHKIVKNLLFARYWEMPSIAKESRTLRALGIGRLEARFRKLAYQQYHSTLERLNESLGTCLK